MISVLKPGLLTTIQETGRYGYQKYGVIASGAMDQLAYRIANILVGNDENKAVLEITMLGPTIQFEKDSLISISGADLSPSINGESVNLWRPIFVKKGSVLRFGPCITGCRAYLAAAGGFAVPTVMNSKSTYLRAKIGGFHGRSLKKGDQLLFGEPTPLALKISRFLEINMLNNLFQEMNWSAALSLIPNYNGDLSIRVMKGREFGLFSKISQERFFSEKYVVTSKSDRMGYRLQGPPLCLDVPAEMISEAVNFGTIQVPADGNPIILLADRQTTGGYPKIGQIATVDLPLVSQAKPGQLLSFDIISHEQAQIIYLSRELAIGQLKQGIKQKFTYEEL